MFTTFQLVLLQFMTKNHIQYVSKSNLRFPTYKKGLQYKTSNYKLLFTLLKKKKNVNAIVTRSAEKYEPVTF